MPFGAMYGALFFTVMALWLILSPAGAPDGLLAPRLLLAAAAGAVGLGLLRRLGWARWGGAALAAVAAFWMARVFLLSPEPAPVMFLVGSLTAAALLLVPVTGRVQPASPAGALGRAAGFVAAAGLAGFVLVSLWREPAPAVATDVPRESTRATAAAAVAPDRVRWTDFGSGIKRAEGEGKPLVVTFIAEWCGYCKQMDRTTWKDPRVIENLADVVAVRVDVEEIKPRNGHAGSDLAARYGVRGTPALLLLDPQGRVLARADGYRDARDTLAWLDGALRRPRGASDPEALQTTTH